MRTDEDLMKSYREGDETAFLELFSRYSPKAYGFIQKRLRDEEVEDFFATVWQNLHEKRLLYKDQPFMPWFFVLIQYLLVEEYRMLGRQRERQEALKLQERDKERFDIEAVILRLPINSRELVRKHFQDELNFPEFGKDPGRERISRTRDYIDFLCGHEALPVRLQSSTQKEILLSGHSKNVLGKFILYEFLGGALSLLLCPQFGLGFTNGMDHFFRTTGDSASALYRSFIFLTAGFVIASLVMKGEEIWWLWRRQKTKVLFYPLVLWGGLLLINLSFNLSRESYLHHGSWILFATSMQAIWLKLRSEIYHWQQEAL